MVISFEIPAQAEVLLRHAFGADMSGAALEAIVVEGYRSGKLSRYDVQIIRGFDNRWDTEEWLGAHGLHSDYSLQDLDADRQTLDRILGTPRS